MSKRTTPDSTTKMAPTDINQDGLAKEDQQRTDGSALDMMQGLHEHEDHTEEGHEEQDQQQDDEENYNK